MAKITLYVPDQEAAKYDLGDETEVTIGRAADCDIILDHSSVSSHHATIRQMGAGMHVLVDTGSTNGIYLEGEQVAEAPLAHGASFAIGSVPGEYDGDEAADSSEEAVPSDLAATSSFGAPDAHLAETSVRPAGFKDLSPVEKVVKKDHLGKLAMALGLVAILAAIALALMSAMMNVA
jgi:predicted component of type VI protein secretion system